jgi:Holliday junction DNA helicase RuvA
MIAWLRGVLRARAEDRVIVDVGGVGYQLHVPIGVAAQAALGDEVTLHVHTHVREDALALFGFEDTAQLQAFNALLGVSGVGPKLAVAILGALSPGALAAAVAGADVARLKAAPGVGKRLAERLAMELKGKLDALPDALAATGVTRVPPVPTTGPWRDLKSALANLQYRPKEVDGVVEQLHRELPDGEFDELLRGALRLLKR